MLILTRKKGQSILIGGGIEIIVSALEGDQVKLAIQAPAHMKIYRKELLEAIQRSNKEAAALASSLAQIKEMMSLEDL